MWRLISKYCVHYRVYSEKKTATVLETRLSLKEKAVRAVSVKMQLGASISIQFRSHEIKKKKFSITNLERCTQYEEFNTLLNSNMKHY